jgi:protein-disulfide isomerase-like protein with CxxC motif
MKYNKKERDLWKSKMIQRAGYKKGTFITDVNKLSDIILNGGQIEMKAQEVRELKGEKVEMIECRIYFIPEQL